MKYIGGAQQQRFNISLTSCPNLGSAEIGNSGLFSCHFPLLSCDLGQR